MSTKAAINIQFPISELILTGQKVVETRTYPIPKKYLNTEIFMIETPGKTGRFKARVVGILKFTKCIKYIDKEDFYLDMDKHCVTPNSQWAWQDKPKFGWCLTVVDVFDQKISYPHKKGIRFTTNVTINSL